MIVLSRHDNPLLMLKELLFGDRKELLAYKQVDTPGFATLTLPELRFVLHNVAFCQSLALEATLRNMSGNGYHLKQSGSQHSASTPSSTALLTPITQS